MPRYDLNRSAPKPRRALVDLRSRRSARLIVALAVALGLAATFLSAETAAAATVTMWGNQRPAGVALDRDTKAVELGTKFVPTAAGKATGVRFYKVKGMKGTHTGTLWSASGKKLASVTFKKETSSGWQTASFGTPVALKAGTTYVVSYHVPAGGRYPATINFKGATTSSALKVGANSGVYKYSSKIAFPKSTWKSSQYWVDVVFAPTIKPAAKPSPTPTATVKPTPTPTPTATATVKPTPTPTPTATATVKPTPTPTPTTSAPAPSPTAGRYPTRTSAGLPAGWSPVREIKGDYWIRTAGTVLEDVRITNGTIFVAATNVTLRRVEGVGARVNNYAGATCGKGLLIEDSTFRRGSTELGDEPTIGAGGYTVRNVVIDGTAEGLRVGGKAACGDVVVQDSFLRILPPDQCRDWHGDGIQGYDGGKLTVRNTVIDFNETAGCGGTAAFFYPSGQGNTSVDIDRLIVSGGGYPFRLGMPGSVTNLGIVDRSWGYGSKEVTSCSALTKWQAKIVTLDTAGQPVAVRDLSC